MLTSSCRRLALGRSVASLSRFHDGILRPSVPASASSPASVFANSRTLLAPFAAASQQLRHGSSSSSSKNSNNSNSSNNNNGTTASSPRSQPLRGRKRKTDGAAATATGTTGKGSKTGKGRSSADGGELEGGKQTTKQKRSLLNALPSVPVTTYLTTKDVALSSFFALHRPVSVTYPVPALYDIGKFSKIFEEADVKQQYNLQRETQKSQRKAIFGIDGSVDESSPYPEHAANGAGASASASSSASAHEHVIEVVEEEASSPDGTSIQVPTDVFLTDSYVPFQPPPAPAAASEQDVQQREQQEAQQQQDEQRFIHQTNETADGALEVQSVRPLQIVFHNVEQMAQVFFPTEQRRNGEQKAASSGGRVQKRYITLVQSMLPDGSIHLTTMTPEGSGQPFLNRMRSRQFAHEERKEARLNETMQALSTKRRRKLKMKKHKLKKLRKRQRNEQRKLNRL